MTVMDCTQWFDLKRKNGFVKFSQVKNITSLRSFIHDRLYSGTTFGTNLKVEHSFKIFLHTAICVLIYLDFGKNQISFWGAMLYACNPINNQTAIWLNGRRYAINIILILLMIAFPLLSPALYFMTLPLQVTAFFSPLLLINKYLWIWILIPLALIIGWKGIKYKCQNRINSMAPGDLKEFKLTRLIVIVKTFGFFFFKMIIPGVCSMQYNERFYWGLTKEGNKDAYAINAEFWQGMVSMVILCGIIAVLPVSVKFYAIFMGLAILQWSAILPIVQILSDRYCSLPNVFMMFFLSYFMSHLPGLLYLASMAILIGYYLICLSVVMPMYKDIMSYYNHHIQYFPSIPWPRTLLISDLMNEGKIEAAAAYVKDALNYNKKEYSLLMWGATMALIKHEFNASKIFLDEAEKNIYIGQEKKQMAEIKNMRKNIEIIMPKKKGFRN